MRTFNKWFMSLPEGRQAVLREDKWMLANAAFEAGSAIREEEIVKGGVIMEASQYGAEAVTISTEVVLVDGWPVTNHRLLFPESMVGRKGTLVFIPEEV